jgi:peptide deformylase
MPKLLSIIINPNQILRKKSLPIPANKIVSAELKKLGRDMVFTMLEKDGVGLAAPQVGKNIRLITINTKNGPLIIIDPEILKKSLIKEWGEEGCLSVPNYFGQVKRYKKIKCKYIDNDGVVSEIEATGLMARVIQHEIDHLDGILFIDKAKDTKKSEPDD